MRGSLSAILVVVLAALAVHQQAIAETVGVSVTYDATTKQYAVKSGVDTTADAFGYYTKNYNNAGWNTLELSMKSEVSSVGDHMQYAKSLGYLEGYATCSEIKGFYNNFYSAVFGPGKVGTSTLSFLKENYDWLKEMSAQNAATDDYWYTVGTVMQQLDGLFAVSFRSSGFMLGTKLWHVHCRDMLLDAALQQRPRARIFIRT
jgi:hypothetical protein